MQPRIHSLRVAGQPVPFTEWGAPSAPTLVFLHGYGRAPDQYAFLGRLAEEQGLRVVAPFLYANHRLAEPPRSFRACVGLTRAALRELGARGALAPGYTLAGHSTGGAVAQCLADLDPAPAGILALDPLMPVRYGPLGFVLRSVRVAARQLLGRSGPALRGLALQLRHGPAWLVNLARRPDVGLALLRDLSRFQLQEFRLLADASGSRGRRFAQPCCVLQARDDELFRPPPDLRAWMGLVFEHFELRELRDVGGHEWPLVEPTKAAQRVAAWRAGLGRLPGAAALARLTA